MYKIRKIQFQNHPILKNLELNFCGTNGKALDTIIFAGENGTGKSTIIDVLYGIASHTVKYPMSVEFEDDNKVFTINYYQNGSSNGSYLMYANDGQGMNVYVGLGEIKNKYSFSGIFSDVDINFHARDISTVTSLTLDSEKNSRRSTENLPTQINQLIVDIQAIDDSELAQAYRAAKEQGKSTDEIEYIERMSRFTTAFNKMFDGLTYSHIENKNGKKSIVFQKNNENIPIDNLSSGEKQVVYRGCFLLKDASATDGAFVFIDEPEISLHPTWQMKVMDYYKGMFSNSEGKQTSQIFAVTHSPFIIHNENRKNDKVIILARDDCGNVVVKDKPEYFKCNSVEAVQDAFQIDISPDERPIVYLEGRTDEMYFNKALEVYEYDVDFQFKWIGYIDDKGEEANTGKDALNKAAQFLIARKPLVKNIFLYDCDTNKPLKKVDNVITLSIHKFDNAAGITVGIENAINFDGIDVQPYRKQRQEIDGYGIEKLIPDFQKMKCCEDICSLDSDKLKSVFMNLKTVIDQLIALINDDVEMSNKQN